MILVGVTPRNIMRVANLGNYPSPMMDNDFAEVREEELQEVKIKLRQAQEENVKLQAVITDLTQVNKRWQRYNNDRQLYVEKLLSTIQDQQEQINKMGEEAVFPKLQEKSGPCQRAECKSLESEIKRMAEKIELLELQLKAHKDDWEAERNEKQQAVKDREAAKIKLAEAMTELYNLKAETCQLDEDHEDSDEEHFSSACSRTRSLTEQRSFDSVSSWRKSEDADEPFTVSLNTVSRSENKLNTQSSSLSLGYSNGQTTLTSHVVIPVMKSSSAPERRSSTFKKQQKSFNASSSLSMIPSTPKMKGKMTPTDEGVETQTRQTITCPGCSSVFPHDRNIEFIDHFERCQRNS